MAEASDVKLLGSWSSPFSIRPRIALNMKNINYQFIQEELGSKSELLLKSNPVHKKIPVMIHNDRPICESLIIVEYIDDAFPAAPSILPSDTYVRAATRFWASYIDNQWYGLLRGVGSATSEVEKERAVEELRGGMRLLEEAFQKLSEGKGFFGGERIGYVDIAFGCCLGWMKVLEKMNGYKFIDEGATPGLHGWAERFCGEDVIRSVMPETDKLLDYAKEMTAAASR